MTLVLVLLQIFPLIKYQENIISGWRGITPIKSSKNDVERIFGLPNNGPEGSYRWDDSTVQFTYSKGNCMNGWDVSKDVVLFVSVILRKDRPLFSDLKIDTGQLDKKKDRELSEVFYYEDKRQGITYVVNGGELTGIWYRPSEKDQSLKCKDRN